MDGLEGLLILVRNILGDTYSDSEIEAYINSAVLDYNQYNPLEKEYWYVTGPGVTEYPLPADFICFYGNTGLTSFGGSFRLVGIPACVRRESFRYYAKNTPDTIPKEDFVPLAGFAAYTALNQRGEGSCAVKSVRVGDNLSMTLADGDDARIKAYISAVSKYSNGSGWF